MISLRDEIRGARPAPPPPFVILLPPGWVSQEPTRENFDELLTQVSAVFRSQHRPDLDAAFRAMAKRSLDEFLRKDPVRIIYPAHLPPDEMVPLSITAVRVTDPDGAPLDKRVHDLVRRHEARPLDDAAMILRWESEDRLRAPEGAAIVRAFNYLIAVPGSERRSALLFTGVMPVEAGETMPDDIVEGARVLMDAIMSTFRWADA